MRPTPLSTAGGAEWWRRRAGGLAHRSEARDVARGVRRSATQSSGTFGAFWVSVFFFFFFFFFSKEEGLGWEEEREFTRRVPFLVARAGKYHEDHEHRVFPLISLSEDSAKVESKVPDGSFEPLYQMALQGAFFLVSKQKIPY